MENREGDVEEALLKNLYAASKAFERNYSRALNVEFEGNGIASTAVCPGWIATELLQKEINRKKYNFQYFKKRCNLLKKVVHYEKYRMMLHAEQGG